MGRRSAPRPTDEQIAKEFSFWQQQIAAGADFVGGDAPDTVDLQLFGLVQMCASIPGRSLAVLRQDPKLERLRAWAETMQQRFGGYQHFYTGPRLEPGLPELGPAPFAERFFYWCGAALMWIAFPITLPLVF